MSHSDLSISKQQEVDKMFICTDQLDDSKQAISVSVDEDPDGCDYPITLKIKIGGYATRLNLSRADALDIMSNLEKAVHQTKGEDNG